MSKTITLKKQPTPGSAGGSQLDQETFVGTLPSYTAAQLRAMLAELEPGVQAVDADKSTLPPVDQRTSAPVQAPPNVHGSFTLNGIPVMASPIKADIDPRTGAPYIQPGPRPSTMISPPPSRRFDGR